jgi:hypothetical protein
VLKIIGIAGREFACGFSVQHGMWEAKTYDPSFETKVFRKLGTAQAWIDKRLSGL